MKKFALIWFALLSTAVASQAVVQLPAVFGDHMVLQQEATLPVWGRADPGEKVTVSFGSKQGTATAGADRKWRIDLPALPPGTPAGTLVVQATNTLSFTDVLVGDVWVCSGQSNMEFSVRKLPINEIPPAAASDSQIRLFHVPHKLAMVPLEDVKASWEVCSPETVSDFTAVGFLFARNLLPVINRPIGLIETSWGATTAQAWTSMDALRSNPIFQPFVDDYTKTTAAYPSGESEFENKVAAYDAAVKDYNDKLAADTDYQAKLKEWQKASGEAHRANLPIPPAPQPPIPPLAKYPQGGHHNAPSALFDAMVNPLIPFAIKGVLWYQGEDNTKTLESAMNYRTLFPLMISDWRKHWNQGNFPFLFVQLAGFVHEPKTAGEVSLWALLRESQMKGLSIPNTGVAIAIDIGSVENIHPPDKTDVALRLCLAARHVAYGEKLVFTGPIYDSSQVAGNAMRISYQPDSLGGGLTIGTSPRVDPLATPTSKTDLQGFAIAGEDRNWVWATAKIDGNSIVVSSTDVPHPVAVRYAWANNPVCNLYNQEGLPASPFRTDDWEISSAEADQAAALTR